MRLVIFIIVILGIVALFALLSPKTTTLQNPYISSSAGSAVYKVHKTEDKIVVANTQGQFQTIFNKYSELYPELDISVDVLDLSNDNHFQLNPDRIATAASTTKLFAASAFITELEKGKYSYDQDLGSFNAKFQLQQMVNQSNNNSWALFYDLMGTDKIEQFTHTIGSKDFNIDDNTLKATDMTNYLAKLYRNQLHSVENTKYLLSLMQNTNEESFVPHDLSTYKIYHKNGQLEEIVNEAVIAEGKDHTYVIAIYTDGKDRWEYDRRQELFTDLITDILI